MTSSRLLQNLSVQVVFQYQSPTIFRYNDWKISFQTMIDRKNIPAEEKTYYLRKYVSGGAKKAIEGYFPLGTELAYYAAWKVLEER